MPDIRMSPSGRYVPDAGSGGPPLTWGFFDIFGNITGTPRINIDAGQTEITYEDNGGNPTAQIRRTDGRAWFQELRISSPTGPRILAGIGDPDGVIVGDIGDVWLRLDGSFNNTIYVKQGFSGFNFGWIALTAFTAPTTPGQDEFAAYASGGDLSYSAGLRFPGGTPLFFVTPKIDNSNGYTVIQFEPAIAPAGPPFFGAGNGLQLLGQHAAPGSGLSGGDSGVQGGNSDGAATGSTAFVQPGTGGTAGVSELRNAAGAARVAAGGANDGVAFFGGVPEAQITVVGLKGGNAALGSLLSALATYGLIVDATGP